MRWRVSDDDDGTTHAIDSRGSFVRVYRMGYDYDYRGTARTCCGCGLIIDLGEVCAKVWPSYKKGQMFRYFHEHCLDDDDARAMLAQDKARLVEEGLLNGDGKP